MGRTRPLESLRTTHAARRHARLAFLYAVPIGLLGGLIGLGGAEFRLPVLSGPLRYSLRCAVPLNLVVSLVTLVASLLVRGRAVGLDPLTPLFPVIGAMIVGGMVSAFAGATFAGRIAAHRLERLVVVLLSGIGALLIGESVLPEQINALVPHVLWWQIGVGAVLGCAIGFVSSVLGVAGGELIIPALIFVFGADIKLAGTASLLISLPTVMVGVARYAQRGTLGDHQAWRQTVAPMGVGSVIGAFVGGLLAGRTSAPLLKLALGTILIVSAARIFKHTQPNHTIGRS